MREFGIFSPDKSGHEKSGHRLALEEAYPMPAMLGEAMAGNGA
jgi:hypothetical protein